MLLLLCTLAAANDLKDLLEDSTTSSSTSTTSSTIPSSVTSPTTPTAYVVSAAAVPALVAGRGKSKSTSGKYVNKSSPRKRKAEQVSSLPLPVDDALMEWKCPNITGTRNAELECGCDLPHTLRCNIDLHGMMVRYF